ncbi:uncharacterized protein LOC131800395 isoform X1 [Musca domestica]|uniref:Uncharacterized protein LOC131800395 isoform X1 n=1 Tax=Musca domestica TaxID=7370 RepID=A0ABM3USZ1_MUSDO|nr:uncharacterized protein LOC131800395 isoform X1 [Musca domestica]
MDLDEEQLQWKLRTRGKCQTFLLQSDYLELKPRARRGKCLGAAIEALEEVMRDNESSTTEYSYIGNDIWFHLANYIAPEDVQRFAMICTQSAECLKSRHFWIQLYRKHCQKSKDRNKWILQLPSHLQMHQITQCDINILRQQVIKALFFCHPPFVDRLKDNYKLESLVGKTYQSSWHLTVQCVWIMVYKFRDNAAVTIKHNAESTKNSSSTNNEQVDTVVNDWESLAENEEHTERNNNTKTTKALSTAPSSVDNCNGLKLLIICCDRFIPFPSDFLCTNSSSTIRLKDTRELLSTDMRSTNLELDFVSLTGDQRITWKYQHIQKYKVLPWWHPDFSKFNKCEL